MDAKYDVPWGAKASWIFFHCSAGWRGNFCGPLIHRKYRCGLKVLGLSKMSAKRTMYLESSMFMSIQKLVFLHVPSSISLYIAYTPYPHITYMKDWIFSLWSIEPTFARGPLDPLALRALALLPLEAEALKLLAVRSRVLDANMTYRYIPIANCIHSLLTSTLQESIRFLCPTSFHQSIHCPFPAWFLSFALHAAETLLLQMQQCHKGKKCNGSYLMSSILVFVLSIMDVQWGWGLVREGMASLCVGQPFFFQQMLIL